MCRRLPVRERRRRGAVVKGEGRTSGLAFSKGPDSFLSGMDCAERFDVAISEEAHPGTVMVDRLRGRLAPSRSPYDEKEMETQLKVWIN
jgi:hypothetical protein